MNLLLANSGGPQRPSDPAAGSMHEPHPQLAGSQQAVADDVAPAAPAAHAQQRAGSRRSRVPAGRLKRLRLGDFSFQAIAQAS